MSGTKNCGAPSAARTGDGQPVSKATMPTWQPFHSVRDGFKVVASLHGPAFHCGTSQHRGGGVRTTEYLCGKCTHEQFRRLVVYSMGQPIRVHAELPCVTNAAEIDRKIEALPAPVLHDHRSGYA